MIQDIKLSHLIHQLNIQSIKVVNKNLFTLRLRVLSIIWNRNRELRLHNHIFFYSLLLKFKSRIFLNTSLYYLKKSTHQNFACHQLNKVKIWGLYLKHVNQLKGFLYGIESTWCLPRGVNVKPPSVSKQSGIVSDTKEFSKNDVCSNAVTEDTFLDTNDGDSIYE